MSRHSGFQGLILGHSISITVLQWIPIPLQASVFQFVGLPYSKFGSKGVHQYGAPDALGFLPLDGSCSHVPVQLVHSNFQLANVPYTYTDVTGSRSNHQSSGHSMTVSFYSHSVHHIVDDGLAFSLGTSVPLSRFSVALSAVFATDASCRWC